jgi:surface antigen
MQQLHALWRQAVLSLVLFSAPAFSWAANYMPFVLGSVQSGSVAEVTEKTRAQLVEAGFEVVGNYAPSAQSEVLVVTNNALKSIAAKSENGGFGAMQRVSIVNRNGQVQVSYTNPVYMWNAYRMAGDITPVQKALQNTLGATKEFGAKAGLSADELRQYHYKMLMPYFDDQDELASYGSYEEAVKKVEAGLASGQAGATKVYRIDIPGKKMSVFGVALKHGEAADGFIQDKIDIGSESHAAHFPYELLVVDDEVVALNGKFRIAINWPSLSMMGQGSFMSISNAPNDIVKALEAAAKNKPLEKSGSGF